MGPTGEGCPTEDRRRRHRARDLGSRLAPRRGTRRPNRVPRAGSGCQGPAACCSFALLARDDFNALVTNV